MAMDLSTDWRDNPTAPRNWQITATLIYKWRLYPSEQFHGVTEPLYLVWCNMDIKYDVMIVDKDKWRRLVTSLYGPRWPF